MSAPPIPSSPPSGDDQSGQVSLYAVTWVFWTLSTLLITARFYTRVKIIKSVGLDDCVMILGWACPHFTA